MSGTPSISAARNDRNINSPQSYKSDEDPPRKYRLTERDHAKARESSSDDDRTDYDLDGDAAGSVMSLHSGNPAVAPSSFCQRPWAGFDKEARSQWETMYANVMSVPLGGSWERTEDYQREKDNEMRRYLEEYPLDSWVIAPSAARQASSALQERDRCRSLGLSIFGHMMPSDTSNFIAHKGHNVVNLAAATPRVNTAQAFAESQRSRTTPSVGYGIAPHCSSWHQTILDPEGRPQHTATQPYQEGRHDANSFPWSAPAPRGRIAKGKGPSLHSPSFPARGLTPPYEVRTRPIIEPRKITSKSSKKPARRMADAEEYPWCRPLDFKAANSRASWDDGIYDGATLRAMEDIRAHNGPIIEDIDTRLAEQQRLARLARKKKLDELGENLDNEDLPPTLAKQNGPKKKDSATGGDAYHSGNFMYATSRDSKRAADLGYGHPDDFISAVEADLVNLNDAFSVKITWNPGTKAMTADLRQAVFSVRDTVLTRRQLQSQPILTRRAAECIIDFCPDMLWRSMLLRVTSEAGLGNKDVRDRFCGNGCYCDKATITKRISAALGQKQIQPKSKGYTKDEWDWYDDNVRDFSRYIDFFGKRTSHRNMLKIQAAAKKHKIEPEPDHAYRAIT